jgi:hypothetical protein
MNRIMGKMELFMVAITPDANHPVKIERDPLAPRQGAVHRIRNEPGDASTGWSHPPQKKGDFFLEPVSWPIEGHGNEAVFVS